jgi:tetratricopeptide (TPR) repeat protein
VTRLPVQPDPAVSPGRSFLDVPWLLEASVPRRPIPRLWFFFGGVIAVLVLSALFSGKSAEARTAMDALSGVLMAGLMAALIISSSLVVRRLRAEQQAVEEIGDMVQLRRWSEAAGKLDRYLSAPTRTASLRAQALVYLGSVLARYQRFSDAVTVYEYLLDSGQIDGGAEYGLRLGRAMAMLREDRLVDADRAISELRRMTPTGIDSPGLWLLELYRDVKTGHAEEALSRFEKHLQAMRQQLGHRVADAWAMAAWALDMLSRAQEAQQAYRAATLLSPPGELSRRYPEVLKLEGKYEPAYAPAEAA